MCNLNEKHASVKDHERESWALLEQGLCRQLAASKGAFRAMALRCADDDVVDALLVEVDAASDLASIAWIVEDSPRWAAPTATLSLALKRAIDRALLNTLALAMLHCTEQFPAHCWAAVGAAA